MAENKVCVLMGSPRKAGNTSLLVSPFIKEMERKGFLCKQIWLYDKVLQPCRACRTCQKDWTIFGCPIQDDMQEIFDVILECELLVLSTPIYSWYCTPPMKSVLDRLVYGMNKYYGDKKGPSLWAGKSVALITTCGYPPEKGADLWEEGIRRYCRHSKLNYVGMLVERHLGYQTTFMDHEKECHATSFARDLSASLPERWQQGDRQN